MTVSIPGCVSQSEAASLQVDAAIHQQLSEEQWGVSWRTTWRVFGLWRSRRWACFKPWKKLNDGHLRRTSLLWGLINTRLFFLWTVWVQFTHVLHWMIGRQRIPHFPGSQTSLLPAVKTFLGATVGESSSMFFRSIWSKWPISQSFLLHFYSVVGCPVSKNSQTKMKKVFLLRVLIWIR